jgi:stage III sporulation protein AG
VANKLEGRGSIMDTFKKLSESINKMELKRFLLPLIILLGVGVIFLVGGRALYVTTPKEIQGEAIVTIKNPNNFGSDLEKELETILSKIQGVGRVSVLITYESGKEIITATNTSQKTTITDERDTQGGIRTISTNESTETVAIIRDGNKDQPIILKEIHPKIKGVLVVVEGASEPNVKMEVFRVMQSLLNISAYRIQVQTMKN